MVRVRWPGIPEYTSWPQLTSPFSPHVAEAASDTGFFCFYNHKTDLQQTRDRAMKKEWKQARGKKNSKSWEGRSRQHSPQSFSGYCCSLRFTTQYSARPQLASVRDYTIFVCVGESKREGERVTDRQTVGPTERVHEQHAGSAGGLQRSVCFHDEDPQNQCKVSVSHLHYKLL